MKKILASVLTLALLVGILPAAFGTGSNAAAVPESMKVLVIGDKFARNGMELFYKVLSAEGYTDICVAYTFKEGISLTEYAAGIAGATPATYNFARNVRDFADDLASGTSLRAAVEWEDWDYIALQTSVGSAEDAAAMTAAVNTLVPYIKTLNSKAEIGLHVDWAKEANAASFAKIAEAAQKTILDSGKIDFAAPVGTAIMNVASSFMGTAMYQDFKTWKTVAKGVREGDQRDDTNLNHLGELIAAYAWYASITGKKVTELKIADTAHVEVNLTAAERKVIMEGINNAISKPYAITKSAYPTEPTQYTAVVVNDHTDEYMVGDTVTITAKAVADGQRKFQKWAVTEGNVTLANATAATTTFKMPAQDVRIEPVYENTKDVTLKVGFGRSDVTPDQPIPLAGAGDAAVRLSVGVHPDYPEDRLTMSAIAFTDGNNTHIVMTTDFIRVPTAWSKKAEDAVYKKYGQQYDLDEYCLSMTATHTHSAPDIGDKEFGILQKAKNVNSHEDGLNYWYFRDFWLPGVVEAAGKALADLAPVRETKVTSVRVPGLGWVRQWRDGKGQLTGVNFTGQSTANGYKGYFRVSDEEMQLVNFVRDNADDVILMNFQAHPNGASSGNWDKSQMVTVGGTEQPISYLYLSSEFPGFASRYVQDHYKDDEGRNVNVAYLQGACGNTNAQCLMSSVKTKYGYDNETNNKWGINTSTFKPDAAGWQLGDYAVMALEEMKTVQTGEVKTLRQQFLATEYQYDVTREIEQDVVTIGSNIAFVTAGYEMFERSGRYVKDNSPYQVTIVMENSQGHEYMPDWQTWHFPLAGGGEPYSINNTQTNVAKGTAEDLAYALVGMLDVTYEE